MKIGMVGLGRMGGNMAERLRRAGHDVVGFDRNPDIAEVKTLAELAEALPPPRVAWVMVPSGEPTRATIAELGELLSAGDLVVDGGNSNWRDSQRHAEELSARSIGFVDAGVSGGVWGRENGYGLMVGGDDGHVALIRPVLEALAPEGGLVHAGPVGAGHFTKMVHNGIEYGLMQAYAEGFELLSASELGIDVPAAVEAWRHGTVIRSWLLDLLARALTEDPGLAKLKGWADD
ncbi:MAG TPA: NADP-dependent phosphogluconate dehydrogenase, partial [Acidimicrobiia bacterium]|nr:NADP-dependent phosphogluconate dehydrogenase [Acidimicrobiia bacterium]